MLRKIIFTMEAINKLKEYDKPRMENDYHSVEGNNAFVIKNLPGMKNHCLGEQVGGLQGYDEAYASSR